MTKTTEYHPMPMADTNNRRSTITLTIGRCLAVVVMGLDYATSATDTW